MNNIKHIKNFFKENGLEWTGLLCGPKDDDFRPATEEDFKKLNNLDYLINFGEDGQIALNAEIDLITFIINGESFDYAVSCYAKEEHEEVCQERNLSKEWISFQLKNRDLVFSTLLRNKCNELKDSIKEDKDRRVKRLSNKIEYLTRSIGKVEAEYERKLKDITEIENLVKEV